MKLYFMLSLILATTEIACMDRRTQRRTASTQQPSTGLEPLDGLLDGLGVGDNVVWQAPTSAHIEPFVRAFLAAQAGTPLAYVSFRLPPAAVLGRFGGVWDGQRFVLVDGWSASPPDRRPAAGQDDQAAPVDAMVRRLADPTDPDAVDAELSRIEGELGAGARYVFDDLTSIQRLWGAEAALALFLRCCPRLYQQRTVAYWLVERDAHQPEFLDRLADITQVVLDLKAASTEASEQVLEVVKADGHPAGVAGRTLGYVVGDDGLPAVRSVAGARERIGQQIRAQRLASGLAQAELARRVGITPSALSQVERGRHGLTGETLTRLWEVLGVPFGAAASPTSAPYALARRGARQVRTYQVGLTGEAIVEQPAGLGMHLLTFAPGSGGRQPVFETKQRELVLVLDGVLELQLGQAAHTLQQDDAIVLATQPLTGWRNPAKEPARALWLLLDH
jgi:transcriptional regulator with XRE-family HTH domain